MSSFGATARFQALGTTAEISTLVAAALPAADAVLRRELEAIDLACSRFRDDSEVMRLRRCGGRWRPASKLLREALAAGIDAAVATGGAVDPTVGRSLRGLGWDVDFSVVVSRREPARFEVVPAAGWRRIELDEERGCVRVPHGIEIDLGATAKALAADRAADAAHRATGSGVLVNLGGDIAVAGPAPEGGWPIFVTDDHRAPAGAAGQTVAIVAGGLATSSTTVRRWPTNAGTTHHIVDPRTGRPVDELWRTVSVAAASCVDANAASTAAIVLGAGALHWLNGLGLPARLVRGDGRVVLAGGWPGEEDAAWAA
jgi:FAD:protein FMN transferase